MDNQPDRVGPSYLEAQYTGWNDAWSGSVALGAAWEWQTLAAGPQATLCTGPIPVASLCARASYLFGEGPQVGIYVVVIAGLAEWVWSR